MLCLHDIFDVLGTLAMRVCTLGLAVLDISRGCRFFKPHLLVFGCTRPVHTRLIFLVGEGMHMRSTPLGPAKILTLVVVEGMHMRSGPQALSTTLTRLQGEGMHMRSGSLTLVIA